MYFLCSQVYQSLYFIIRWHWHWWWWATLILFPQDILNILLFPSMAVDLADLATRDNTPFARSIFDVYILLLDPCLKARNWSLWMNEKKSYTLLIYGTLHICTIRTCRDAFNRSVKFSDTYVHIYTCIHTSYIYTFIHIRSYIYVHTYIHTYIYVHGYTFIYTFIHTFIHIYTLIHIYIYIYIYTHTHTHIRTFIHMSTCITKERKKEICNKYVLTYFLFKKFFRNQLNIFNTFCTRNS